MDASDVSGKVGGSYRLDGIGSAGYIQGTGTADGQAVATAPNTIIFVGPAIGGLVRLRYQCPFNVGANGVLGIINSSPSLANLFVDSGGANPDFLQLASGGFIDYPTAAGGESWCRPRPSTAAGAPTATLRRSGWSRGSDLAT